MFDIDCVSPEMLAVMSTVPAAQTVTNRSGAHVRVLLIYWTSFKNRIQFVLGRIIPGHKLIVKQTNFKRCRQFRVLSKDNSSCSKPSAISVKQIYTDPHFPYLYSESDDSALPYTLFVKYHVIRRGNLQREF